MGVRARGMEDHLDAAKQRLDSLEQRIGGLEVTMTKFIKRLDQITASRKDCGSKKKNHEGENDGGHGDEIGGNLDPPWKPMMMEDQREEDSAEDSPEGDTTTAEGGDEEPQEEDSPLETLNRSAVMAKVRSLSLSHSLTVKGSDNGVGVLLREDSTLEAPCLGGTVTGARLSNNLGKISISHVTVRCDKEVEEERSRGDDQAPATATAMATATGGEATMMKVYRVRDGESDLVLLNVARDWRQRRRAGFKAFPGNWFWIL